MTARISKRRSKSAAASITSNRSKSKTDKRSESTAASVSATATATATAAAKAKSRTKEKQQQQKKRKQSIKSSTVVKSKRLKRSGRNPNPNKPAVVSDSSVSSTTVTATTTTDTDSERTDTDTDTNSSSSGNKPITVPISSLSRLPPPINVLVRLPIITAKPPITAPNPLQSTPSTSSKINKRKRASTGSITTISNTATVTTPSSAPAAAVFQSSLSSLTPIKISKNGNILSIITPTRTVTPKPISKAPAAAAASPDSSSGSNKENKPPPAPVPVPFPVPVVRPQNSDITAGAAPAPAPTPLKFQSKFPSNVSMRPKVEYTPRSSKTVENINPNQQKQQQKQQPQPKPKPIVDKPQSKKSNLQSTVTAASTVKTKSTTESVPTINPPIVVKRSNLSPSTSDSDRGVRSRSTSTSPVTPKSVTFAPAATIKEFSDTLPDIDDPELIATNKSIRTITKQLSTQTAAALKSISTVAKAHIHHHNVPTRIPTSIELDSELTSTVFDPFEFDYSNSSQPLSAIARWRQNENPYGYAYQSINTSKPTVNRPKTSGYKGFSAIRSMR